MTDRSPLGYPQHQTLTELSKGNTAEKIDSLANQIHRGTSLQFLPQTTQKQAKSWCLEFASVLFEARSAQDNYTDPKDNRNFDRDKKILEELDHLLSESTTETERLEELLEQHSNES